MLCALNAIAVCTSTADAYSIVHFAWAFCAKTINLNIRHRAKCSNRRITSANRAIEWVSIRVCAARLATVTITSNARVSSTRRMHRFHVQSAIMRRHKRRISACQRDPINSGVKDSTMITKMMITKRRPLHPMPRCAHGKSNDNYIILYSHQHPTIRIVNKHTRISSFVHLENFIRSSKYIILHFIFLLNI